MITNIFFLANYWYATVFIGEIIEDKYITDKCYTSIFINHKFIEEY
jgi:hypothetical protein